MTNNKLKWIKNKQQSSTYNKKELMFFSEKEITNALKFQKTHPLYTNTPLLNLPQLAKHLHLSEIIVKDESQRFGLNAFKVMGGIYAIGKYLAEKLNRKIESLSFEELQTPKVRALIGDITFISATDGNHGRGVAWAARELGQKAIIYMPRGSSKERLEAIRNEGAEADIKDMNYDDTVRHCEDLANKKGYVMVQDTAWEGYDAIPLWIMQGYSGIAKEIIDALEGNNQTKPTHIFLQAGVGSFAAGVAAYFIEHYKSDLPKIIIVEPDLADCYYKSFASESGERKFVTGDMNSIMAGLCCGEPNTRAFRILSHYALGVFSCDDTLAALGMRVLGHPLDNDPRIISGESGAIPLGLLYYLRAFPNEKLCKSIQLDEDSSVLFINTEGDTDAKHYQEVVWHGKYPIK